MVEHYGARYFVVAKTRRYPDEGGFCFAVYDVEAGKLIRPVSVPDDGQAAQVQFLWHGDAYDAIRVGDGLALIDIQDRAVTPVTPHDHEDVIWGFGDVLY